MATTPGIMWNPTHIQFSVLRARNLVSKGKGGNNDVFVCIQLGKEKYQTSVIKHTHHPEWFEECDMPIPHMHTEVQITLYHRGVLSDDFLGYTAIPLWEHKVYERPKSQWLKLQGRPGKSPDTKQRGEIEIRITFHVKSKSDTLPPSVVLSKKRSSLRNIASAVGDKLKGRSRSFRDKDGQDRHHESYIHRDLNPQGSNIVRSSSIPDDGLKSLGLDEDQSPSIRETRSKSLYLLPGDRWSQIELPPYTQSSPSRNSTSTGASSVEDPKSLDHHDTSYINGLLRRERDNHDSNSENSHSSGYSRTHSNEQTEGLPPRPNRYSSEIESSDPETREPPIINKISDNNNVRDVQNMNNNNLPANFRNMKNNENRHLYPGPENNTSLKDNSDTRSDVVNVRRRSKRDRARLYKLGGRRYTVQGIELHSPIQPDDQLLDLSEAARRSKQDIVPSDLINVFRNMTKEELVRVVITHKAQLMRKDLYIKDLEKYIDNLLVRVMESTPKLLQQGLPRLPTESRRK